MLATTPASAGGASSPATPSASPRRKAQLLLRARPEAGFTHSYLVHPPASTRGFVTLAAPVNEPPASAAETLCHGLLRDPKPAARLPPPEMPDPLVFMSWWNEEVATPVEFTPSGQGMGVRRQVKLHYLPTHGSFQLLTEDGPALTLSIEHADGTPVGPHELFVGAKLDVLGRPMTLRSASARTITWIDSEAKRLMRRREALCVQIAKFRDVHKALEACGISQLYLNPQMTPSSQATLPSGGKANLKRLHMEIEALQGLLMRYRS